MIYVINDNNNPFFNHAAEEYLMENFHEEVFMLWINRPALLIGRNQNTLSEINLDYVKKNNMTVVRRLSGGGTVYNDLGNINFTFITHRDPFDSKVQNGFKKFALPIINALQSLGINAEFTGRNDIVIDNKKFSGNAQYFQKDKLLHHGTILYNCNMKDLPLALKVKDIKFVDKSVKSVASRVTNIYPYMKDKMDVLEFREYLKDYIIKTYNIKNIYQFNERDIEEINKISKNRFETWEWNYGKSPDYKYKNIIKYPSGIIEYNLNVENGSISNISIYGDFFGEKDIKDIEIKLIGVKHNIAELMKALNNINIDDYILGLTKEEFVSGLIDTK